MPLIFKLLFILFYLEFIDHYKVNFFHFFFHPNYLNYMLLLYRMLKNSRYAEIHLFILIQKCLYNYIYYKN